MHILGWLGMITTVAWLAYRIYQDSSSKLKPLSL